MSGVPKEPQKYLDFCTKLCYNTPMFASRRRFCGEPHESDKPPKSNLFINEWGFVDDELPIRYTPRFTLRQDQRAQKNLFMQNKPNFPNAQILVNCVLTMDYVNIRLRRCAKNKAKYAENKANSNPIQTQFKPISMPNKPSLNSYKFP